MDENHSKKKSKKNKKCKIKCGQCEFYDAPLDYCSQKEIENCTMQTHINFSSCESFLIRENLAYF